MADMKLIASDEFANLRFQSGTSSLLNPGLSPIVVGFAPWEKK